MVVAGSFSAYSKDAAGVTGLAYKTHLLYSSGIVNSSQGSLTIPLLIAILPIRTSISSSVSSPLRTLRPNRWNPFDRAR